MFVNTVSLYHVNNSHFVSLSFLSVIPFNL